MELKLRSEVCSPPSADWNRSERFLVDPVENREAQGEIRRNSERFTGLLILGGGKEGQLFVSPSLCGSVRFIP